MKAELVRLSVCGCGFPAIGDEIPLGTIYDVDLGDTHQFTWVCGGCGKLQSVDGVFVAGRGASPAGYLPRLLFKALDEHDASPEVRAGIFNHPNKHLE